MLEKGTEIEQMNEKTYTYQEALCESMEYFNGDELPASIFVKKYALKNEKDELIEKSPTDMHWRIAKEFARIEKDKFKNPLSAEDIFKYLDKFSQIIPQGSPMFGIGNKYQNISLSNCFLIPSAVDSYSGIMFTDEQIVQISKRRGGVGHDISNLRPSGTPTKNAAKTSSGAISFMSRFSNSGREVGQNGRRGAQMLSCSIHHPESVIPWDNEVDGNPYDVNVKYEGDMGNVIDIDMSSKYYNPKKIDFATCKYDRNKVTGANISLKLTDEFMKAVKEGKTFEQRWPINSKNPKIRKDVSAKDVWDKIIYSSWQTAEPGVLFWDNIIRESPADCYFSDGFTSVGTNPCLTGDTLVYVADGRGDVSIKQLALEGKDVDVFCYDKNGKICIRKMRNPRLTGKNKKVYRIKLDDGSIFRATDNHKIKMNNGEYKEVKDLEYGDSLALLTKYELNIKDVFHNDNSNSQDYYWINNGNNKGKTLEHRIIAEHNFNDGKKFEKGIIIHHKDYDAKNNNPENLEVMTKENHDIFHSKDMIGDKNPMRRAKKEWSIEKWNEYAENMSKAISGEKNGKFSGYSNDDLRNFAIKLTKKLNRRFSKKDWIEFAVGNNLPKSFSNYRKKEIGNIVDLAKWAAIQVLENKYDIDTDPRLIKTLDDAILQGYSARIKNGLVVVTRKCEYCGEDYEIDYFNREICFCGRSCSNRFLNSKETNIKRTQSINLTYSNKSNNTKERQTEAFSQLAFELDRKPKLLEWEDRCRLLEIPFRLRTKNGFKSFDEIEESASVYNHKIVSVEFDSFDDVYNGTVDDFHNFFIGGWEGKSIENKHKSCYINNLQCGEIPLSPYDSCRLMALNSFGFVKNPFESNSYFDYEQFYEAAKINQRLMDDLVDLEAEAIKGILNKIENDPEEQDIKNREKALWQNILDACLKGRRTGTGVTAIGDTLAAIGVGYGTKEGVETIEKIYRTLKFGAYRSSVDMAKEIGTFNVFDYEKEKNNPFINRIENEEIDFGNGKKISGKKLWEDNKKYGRRNIALLTTAPAGTVSILCKLVDSFGTSSGIEPEYTVEPYTRKVKGNPEDKNFRTDEIDQSGDHFMKFKIFCPAVKDWMKVTGKEDIKESPWWGHCAEQLDWSIRVDAQAAAQKNVDHSISSTLNLPSDVSVEKVSEIYMKAYESGCKGITVYRDGCRTGVLVKDGPEAVLDKDTHITKTSSPKRPKDLPCDVNHLSFKLQRYYVAVGILNGDPYEVFTGINADKEGDIVIPRRVTEGKISKKSRGSYYLATSSPSGEEESYHLTNGHVSDLADALTRNISMSLRHGIDISYIVHQLEKTKGDLQSFSKVLARTLKKYISNGTLVSGESCPDCNNSSLVRSDGCVTCKSCGWSKCA